MKKILITQGTNSLAFKVNNILSDSFSVTLGTSTDIPSVLKDNFLSLPKVDSSSYIHEMLKIAIANNIDCILPLEIKEIDLLGHSLVLFEEYGIKVFVPNPSELSDIQYIDKAPSGLELVLLNQGRDLLSDTIAGVSTSGLGVLSDSGDEFILVTV